MRVPTTTASQQASANWTANELSRIATADELQIAPRLPNGTFREPTTIWVVAAHGRLYVRSAYGHKGTWWRAARRAGRGRIRSAGVERDVEFRDTANDLNDAIDAAYRSKYRRYSPNLVNTMVTSDARSTTLELAAL